MITMKNVFRIFGVIIWLCDLIHFFGFFPVKEGAFVAKPVELLIAFALGLILLVVPPAWFGDRIKTLLDKFASKKIDKM